MNILRLTTFMNFNYNSREQWNLLENSTDRANYFIAIWRFIGKIQKIDANFENIARIERTIY